MKYLGLMWANLFRRRVRTILTLLSVLVAFLLFTILRTVVVLFDSGVDFAVVGRTVEIATLRALGFGGGVVVVSVMVEAIALALLGGLLGAAIAYLGFNGLTVSTLNNTSFSQVAFDFAVTPQLMQEGIILAVGLGLIGGLFPAVRAARLPITVALRGE